MKKFTCLPCEGKGKAEWLEKDCPHCKGSGLVGPKTHRVQVDIQMDSAAVNEIDALLADCITAEVIEELNEKRQYHVNRLVVWAFSLNAAWGGDEEAELIEIGRKVREDEELMALMELKQTLAGMTEDEAYALGELHADELLEEVKKDG